MKKSNVVLIVLLAIFLAGYFGNIFYIKSWHSKVSWRIDRVNELVLKRDSIYNVFLTDSSQLKQIEFGYNGNPHWTIEGDTASIAEFFRSCRINRNTLVVFRTMHFSAENREGKIKINISPYRIYVKNKLIKEQQQITNWSNKRIVL
jgi:hypothetical protein